MKLGIGGWFSVVIGKPSIDVVLLVLVFSHCSVVTFLLISACPSWHRLSPSVDDEPDLILGNRKLTAATPGRSSNIAGAGYLYVIHWHVCARPVCVNMFNVNILFLIWQQ